YISSAKDLSNRLARYYRPSELIRIKGSLIHRALLKYDYENFSIYILKTYNSSELIIREQNYINLLKPIYNIFKFAHSSQGYMHNEETRKIMS
ncbi:hypothetical protein BDB00DRAFT_767486, partial [Zychaea mexicana]|uniref:uncharacterized protein n=1 Tax=Zychaea mexicana TaxID=64656 RepID=UPI0022FF2D67